MGITSNPAGQSLTYSTQQRHLIDDPVSHKYCEGIPGTGKTTGSLGYLESLAFDSSDRNGILVLTPQRSLAVEYHTAVGSYLHIPHKEISITTYAGIARQMVKLFWPLIVETDIFSHPEVQPVFLTIETTLYHLNKLISPLIEQGYFQTITIERHLLLSQIIDNLNKSVLVGIPLPEIYGRLLSASVTPERVSESLAQTQNCMELFRGYCLENSLVDYSLQMELFNSTIQNSPLFQDYFFNRYQHFIIDNLEEETPVAHDIFLSWIQNFSSSLVIKNQSSGYRYFLGADPISAERLREFSQKTYHFDQQLITPPHLENLRFWLQSSILKQRIEINEQIDTSDLKVLDHTYLHEQISDIADEVNTLITQQGVHPSNIALLSPFVTDAAQFFLTSRFEQLGIPVHAIRPSKPLIEDPIIKHLFTLSKIAHPNWGMISSAQDVALMLTDFIDGMDFVRSNLLTEICYSQKNPRTPFSKFDDKKTDIQSRITVDLGEKFDRLASWINSYIDQQPVQLNLFILKLFEIVLIKPGFRLSKNRDAASKVVRLYKSYEAFLSGLPQSPNQDNIDVDYEFMKMHQDKVFTPYYPEAYSQENEPSVLFAPLTTFLQMNKFVDYQFWLDISSPGWWERIYQPLTHPHVLSRNWQPGDLWTDDHEYRANQEKLITIVSGLIWRCRKNIYFCSTAVSDQGNQQKGPLLQALNRLYYWSLSFNEKS